MSRKTLGLILIILGFLCGAIEVIQFGNANFISSKGQGSWDWIFPVIVVIGYVLRIPRKDKPYTLWRVDYAMPLDGYDTTVLVSSQRRPTERDVIRLFRWNLEPGKFESIQITEALPDLVV